MLTYGSQLWFTRGGQRTSLLKQAQVVQNDAICWVARCFHMTPVDPLHHLLAILPIRYTLTKLNGLFSDRLLCLPLTHALYALMSTNTAALWDCSLDIPSTLSALMPLSFPPYVLLAPPSVAPWSHCRVHYLFLTKPLLDAWLLSCRLLCSVQPPGLLLIVSLYPHPDCFIACFVLLQGGQMEASSCWCSGAGTGALLLALVKGLCHASGYHVGPLHVFLPNQAIVPLLFQLTHHSYLPLSSEIVSLVSNYVDYSLDLYVDFYWYSVK